MSGHSKWHNIQAKKGKADAARGKIFTKLGRELLVAVKQGGPDPEGNSTLKAVIAKCKAANMPNDTINNAIKKASGEGSTANYEEIIYEGYGNLGTTGCVSYMFSKKGVIVIEKETCPIDEEELMMLVLDAGADDFNTSDEVYEITTDPSCFTEVSEKLQSEGISFLEASVQMVPSTTVSLDEQSAEKMEKMIERLEDLDDVMNVYHNWE